MIRTTFQPADKTAVPTGVEFFSLLLLLYGVLEFIGCFFMPRNILLLGYIAIAILLTSTPILVLFNHKWALHFVLLVTIAATLDSARDFWLQNFGFSTHTIWLAIRLLLLIGLYWGAYVWYRNWRNSLNTRSLH
jgi:hypothetical protein